MSDNRRCAMCGRWSHRSRFCDECRDWVLWRLFAYMNLALALMLLQMVLREGM
jgi:hypothetical protein